MSRERENVAASAAWAPFTELFGILSRFGWALARIWMNLSPGPLTHTPLPPHPLDGAERTILPPKLCVKVLKA